MTNTENEVENGASALEDFPFLYEQRIFHFHVRQSECTKKTVCSLQHVSVQLFKHVHRNCWAARPGERFYLSSLISSSAGSTKNIQKATIGSTTVFSVHHPGQVVSDILPHLQVCNRFPFPIRFGPLFGANPMPMFRAHELTRAVWIEKRVPLAPLGSLTLPWNALRAPRAGTRSPGHSARWAWEVQAGEQDQVKQGGRPEGRERSLWPPAQDLAQAFRATPANASIRGPGILKVT